MKLCIKEMKKSYFKTTLALFVLSFASSCSWFSSNTNTNTNTNTNANTNIAKDESQPTPPFATKEPEKFQAKMILSASVGDGSQMPSQVFSIWRDGDKRRVEFEQGDEKIAFLQIPSGQFALNLTKKEYSDLKLSELGNNQTGKAPSGVPSKDNLLDRILNQTRTNAKYEKLGQEDVDGRMTTKYRVTSQEEMNTGAGANEKVTVDSFIWVDESLGMPIKSVTDYKGANGQSKGVTSIMEVKEIKLEPAPASLFEIPKGFKKVNGQ